jgi:hypothetical protein
MNTQKQVEQRRERQTEEKVLQEVRNVLEFAESFFRARNKIILATNIKSQLAYFTAAEAYEALETEQEQLVATVKAN